MNSNEDSLSGAEDFIEAEIEAAEMDSPTAELEIRAALEKLPGLRELTIAQNKLSVRYDPTLVSKKKIADAIASAGHPACHMEAGRTEGHADPAAPAGTREAVDLPNEPS